ncbi:MAG: beta-glucosidase [Candidatus Hodarchaeota archaeon]
MTSKYSKRELATLPFNNSSLDIESRVDDLLNRLTLDEKFKLLSGRLFYQTRSIKRLGIKPFKMTDGPLGISMHSSFFRKNTRFPGGICLASTFNRQIANEFGVAVGKEARSIGIHALLAPGINIHRTPFNGRTYEYFSEDPYLTKEIAIPFVKGVQSQRVASCLKHYVANNQETNRHTVSAEMDERTLHEIYLRAFMETVKEADPWMIMTAYNKVNGQYLHGNKKLLRQTLWDKWNFNGFVVSDWYALSRSDPPVSTEECLLAGLSLEMPKRNKYNPALLQAAHNDGKFSNEDLDAIIRRLLRVMFLVGLFEDKNSLPTGKRNTPDHQQLARRMAEDGMILLKNNNNILPLDISKIHKLAVLGPNKDKKFGKWLYGLSAAVKPPYEITPYKGLKNKCKGKIKIVSDPSSADYAIIFAGLNHDRRIKLIEINNDEKMAIGNDSEGSDRNQLELPANQVDLINQTVKQNPNTIVVLLNGSPIAMDSWLENVPAVLEAWYPGMEGGRAITNILFGSVNPSGKLPITFPKKITDSPAHQSVRTFPGIDLKVYYDEGIYVGYRYFDKKYIEPLFPFGYGLSYTDFRYNNLRSSTNKITKEAELNVSVDITNTGKRFGAEVIQVYSHDIESRVDSPIKELVGFEKVYLDPNEKKTVKINLKMKDLAFYDKNSHSWVIEPGDYKLLVGVSSRDILFEDSFEII